MNLRKAIEIAVEAHKNQVDKVGMPYVLHLFSVMNRCKTEIEKICAVLHDLIEDTPWTAEDLKAEGFSEEIIHTVLCLTKIEGETTEVYLQKVKSDQRATQIKIYDLEDNMDVRRMEEVLENDRLRLNRYLKIYRELTNFINSNELP